jgi:hypothetical protein
MAITQLLFKKGNFLGEIELDAIITEGTSTSSEITTNPVQSGVDFSDHIIAKPMTFRMTGVVSNASANVIDQLATNAFTPRKDQATWTALSELQAKKIPFELVQGIKTYPLVQITSLSEDQDKNTYSSLFFTANLQEIIIPGQRTVSDQFDNQNTSDQASPTVTGGLKQAL